MPCASPPTWKTTTSCGQNGRAVAAGCYSSAPRERFLPSLSPLLCAAPASDDRLICYPEIREAVTSTIAVWNGLPQALTRLFAPIPNRISHHLTCLAAQGNPNPGVVPFFEYKRPQFIQFQRRGRGILWVRGEQGGP